MSKLFGYARVSTIDQNLNLQIDALKKAGCLKQDIYTDKVSGSKTDRPNLDLCLSKLMPGDTLVVWRLDRLGRSMSHLIQIIEKLLKDKIGFKSICDGALDTTTASGELMFNIFSSLAQFEKRLIQERTRAGLAAGRARGRVGGRPKVLSYDSRVIAAKKLYQDNTMPIDQICINLKIKKSTFYNYLKK